MLRKLCKLALLPALLALAAGPQPALAAGPQPALAQAPPAGTPAVTTPAAAPEAAIWAATARYVYQDDPELKTLLPDLLATVKATSIEGFKQGLNKAVKLENKKPKDSHIFMFQTKVFEKVQQQNPANAPALAAAIGNELLAKHPERQDKPTFQNFIAEINSLAKPATPATAASASTTPVAAADNPMDQVGAPVAAVVPLAAATTSLGAVPTPPASQWVWLSLALSILSLGISLILWNKLGNTREKLATLRRTVEVLGQKPAGGSASPPVLTTAIKQEITRQMDQRVAEKQAKAAVAPAATTAPVPAPAVEVAPVPTPRLRTQYVGEAPFNNSFPARALSDQPGTYSMFAIESSEEQPEQGTFAVTGNLASHVRDHRSVLEPVCEYVGGYPLGSETRVITEQPGVVHRRGDDWQVTQRAKVRFE